MTCEPPPSIRVRQLTPGDLPFADSLRAVVGWNQTRSDWLRFLELEPEGCFLALYNGAPCGTVTTTRYGTDLAWIGMLLVHPEFRGRGIGSALLQTALNFLPSVACIKLDATPLGRNVYLRAGFKDEWTFTRWALDFDQAQAPSSLRMTPPLPSWTIHDLPQSAQMDAQAQSADRTRLLALLAQDSVLTAVYSSNHETIEGFAMLRPGARAFYLGPCLAHAAETGRHLLTSLLLTLLQNRPASGCSQVYCDVPDHNTAAIETVRQFHFQPQRQLWRMYYQHNSRPSIARLQFALADPALG